MDRRNDHYESYSWHQSHDQATVILLVPYDTLEDDVSVAFERNYLVAGIRGQPPIVKGRLYGGLDVTNSSWQLEPRTSNLSARGRTTSTTSTTSTQSSYAVVSETEISSSFAASVEGLPSDFEDAYLSSPALSSPVSSSDEHNGLQLHHPPRRHPRFMTSHSVSPHALNPSLSLASSYSSLESLNAGSGRLLTIHLEKADSVIWPSLVVGPVPEALAPCSTSIFPWFPRVSNITENRYNMDPTSLVLIALELADIRENREEAFEYFVRAWHQAHPPSATIRLASHYLPINAVLPELLSSPLHTPTTPTNDSAPESPRSADSTPVSAHAMAPYSEQQAVPIPGSLSYYLYHVGGAEQLAQLYLEAGLLYLEGTAPSLLSSSYAGLSSLRTPTMSATYPQPSQRPSYLDVHMSGSAAGSGSTSGSEAWRRDQEVARRFFDRARDLHPGLDVPLLPPSDSDPDSSAQESPVSRGEHQLKMPTIELPNARDVSEKQSRKRQRQRKTETASVGASTESVSDRVSAGDEDNTWYLYLPAMVGAVLVVGFLSVSSWRRNQYS